MNANYYLLKYFFPTTKRNLGIASIVLAMGLIILAIRVNSLNNYLVQKGEENLQHLAWHIQEEMVEKAQMHEQLLKFSSSFLNASDSVTPFEWRDFIGKSSSGNSYNQDIEVGYAVLVNNNKPRLQELRPGENTRKIFSPQPPDQKDHCVPLFFPDRVNVEIQRKIGIDICADSIQNEALMQARDSGQAFLAGDIISVGNSGDAWHNYVLMYYPVYEQGKPTNTISQKREAIVGWVFSPVCLDEQMSNINRKVLGNDSGDMVIEVLHQDPKSPDKKIFKSKSEGSIPDENFTRLSASESFRFNGVNWKIVVSQDISTTHFSSQIIKAALVWGSILSFILFLLALSLLNTRNQARKIAKALTVKLEKNELRMEFAMLGAKEVGWEFNPRTGQLIITPSLYNLVKYNSEFQESDVSFLYHYFHPDDRKIYDANLQQFVDGEAILFESEFRLIPPGSEVTYFRSRAMKYVDSSSKDVIIYGVFENITTKKLSELQILELKSIVEHCPLSIAVTDITGKMEYINPAFTSITGYTCEDVYGNNMGILKSGKTSSVVYEEFWNTILSGRAWKGEFINRTKHGVEYVESTTITPIYDSHNQLHRFMAISDDISEKRKLQNELEENMHRLNLVIKGSRDAPWDWNLLTHELTFSPQWFNQLGYSEKEFLPGRDYWMEFVHPEDRDSIRERFRQAIEGSEDCYEVEYRLMHLDGHYLPILSRGFISRDQNGSATRVTGTDMNLTSLKETEKLLNFQNQQLKELIATKDKFFKIIAHDLKNPFNSILGLTELISTSQDELNKERILKFVKSIQTTGLNTYRLLENLLVWARTQTGDIQFEPTEFYVEQLLTDAIALNEGRLQSKNITVSLDIEGKLKTKADRRMIETVLRNLITNAVKFTNKEGIIYLTALQSHDKVKISVRDTGIGMSKHIASNLFDISVRTTQPGTDGENGTGLGLLLCKEFLARHRESITVESKEGEGSVFTFTLPLA